jgi:collagenase-like PrtC family protease
MRTLELLAPAKNLECGIAAIDHGADAVYIGARHFGARVAAGNSLEDIKTLTEYAHQFGAKIHVTVNTIIYDREMESTLELIRELERIGVDALLVQDMGLLSHLKDCNMSLHSSTQCDTRSIEKVRWLSSLGFERVVLARELSAEEIKEIHEAVPDVELEAFVHGALCVSYSGVCYASQYCFDRSANRGECAQFCRLKFDLKDSDNHTIEHQRHLLSLKDMCQIDNMDQLVEAGASAFKIEGRLKNVDYVKNVVSAYNKRLDEIVAKNPDKYCRESRGKVKYFFEPNLNKTFNRGYTSYFMNGRKPDIFSPDTPKALGEYVGKIKEMRHDSFNVAGTASFSNGDGLCFINESKELVGFRVNRAVGNRLYPYKMPQGLKAGTGLYRNNDQAFERLLSGRTAERRISVTMQYGLTEDGFKLAIDNIVATVTFEHQEAKKPQGENIVRQLTKLGGTIYECDTVEIEDGADKYFVPSSLLSDLRRKAIEAYNNLIHDDTKQRKIHHDEGTFMAWQPEYKKYPYLYNISNKAAVQFYENQGLKNIRPAFELDKSDDSLIMQCRHCIRYSLGYCVKRGGKHPTWKEPLFLELPDHRRFKLEFRCDECQMNVLAIK